MRRTFVGFAVVVGLSVCGTRTMAADSGALIKPGEKAPTFSLPALGGSREVLRVWCGDTLLKPYANDVKHTVIVNFWATYCKPCQKEIPQIGAFLKKHEGEPVKAFFVSIDKEGVDKVGPFVKDKGYDVTVLLDTYARTAKRYGVKSVPALFVIAPDGSVFYSASGYDESTNLTEKLEGIYAAIKAGEAPASGEVEVAGDQVAVEESSDSAPPAAAELTPKERWQAVIRVECGEKPADVAEDMGIDITDLRTWSKQLKQAAVKLWAE
ncbi:redoxin domain-containing protein [bacterium]|nr:redoxin domain-containing protein [bacterium]MBD3243148.1 redoxin domain-containing protein [Chitinivibrionales bacterium]